MDALGLIKFLCFACERRFLHTIFTSLTRPVPGFSALRVYALLDGKKLIAGVVFLLNLVPFVTNLVGHISYISPHTLDKPRHSITLQPPPLLWMVKHVEAFHRRRRSLC